MEKIKEVIVVEGKNDTLRLKQFFDCDTIETHGTCLSQFTISLIAKIQRKRGVIVLTDPDSPGNQIRNQLDAHISNLKHAFIPQEEARGKNKIGVEHASFKTLQTALENIVTFGDVKGNIQVSDLVELGLSGATNSEQKRYELARFFHLGKANSKTLVNRLNMMGLTREDIIEVVHDCNNQKNK